jgi:hypothetical protein
MFAWEDTDGGTLTADAHRAASRASSRQSLDAVSNDTMSLKLKKDNGPDDGSVPFVTSVRPIYDDQYPGCLMHVPGTSLSQSRSTLLFKCANY